MKPIVVVAVGTLLFVGIIVVTFNSATLVYPGSFEKNDVVRAPSIDVLATLKGRVRMVCNPDFSLYSRTHVFLC